jgi:hypothetical protein
MCTALPGIAVEQKFGEKALLARDVRENRRWFSTVEHVKTGPQIEPPFLSNAS